MSDYVYRQLGDQRRRRHARGHERRTRAGGAGSGNGHGCRLSFLPLHLYRSGLLAGAVLLFCRTVKRDEVGIGDRLPKLLEERDDLTPVVGTVIDHMAQDVSGSADLRRPVQSAVRHGALVICGLGV